VTLTFAHVGYQKCRYGKGRLTHTVGGSLGDNSKVMSKFDRSWQLFKASLKVMTRHRTLLVFPLIVSGATLAIVLLFLAPIGAQPTGQSYLSFGHWNSALTGFFGSGNPGRDARSGGNGGGTLALIYFAGFYFMTMGAATFCNVAFYHEILKALRGEAVSVRAGMQFAATKWRAILLWTLLVSAVGVILKSLERRASIFGQIAIGFVGTAWSVASVFAIPVMIKETETINPLKMVKKSAETIKKDWGESLIGYAGVSIGNAYITMFSVLFLGGGIYLALAANLGWLVPMIAGSWLLMIVALALVSSLASQIFRCALYVYATEGTLPGPYNKEMMSAAWKWAKN